MGEMPKETPPVIEFPVKRRSRFRFSHSNTAFAAIQDAQVQDLHPALSERTNASPLHAVVDVEFGHDEDDEDQEEHFNNDELSNVLESSYLAIDDRDAAGDSVDSREVSTFGIEISTSTKLSNWRILWGVLMTTGSLKLTKNQYQAMRTVTDAFRNVPCSVPGSWKKQCAVQLEASTEGFISSLPHFTTLAKKFKPYLFRCLTVRSVDSDEPIDLRKAGARAKKYTADGTPHAPVRIVLPSEYARQDVATCKVFDLMRSTSLTSFIGQGCLHDGPAITVDECVDVWPVVAAREHFYGPPQRISIDRHDQGDRRFLSQFAETGDTISVTILGSSDLCEQITSSFGRVVSNEAYNVLKGEIVSVWPVQHKSRKGCTEYEHCANKNLSVRDKAIVDRLSFLDYQSPSDDVTVEIPELPVEDLDFQQEEYSESPFSDFRKRKRVSAAMKDAIKARRDALKNKKKQSELAWLNWVKRALKPGDIACLLRPCPSQSTSDERIVLIHRFWIENEERRRHIVYIPFDAPLEHPIVDPVDANIRNLFRSFSDVPSDVTRDVIYCKLSAIHSRARGLAKYAPVSSVGTLENGERYFLYRFLLFWDGFEVSQGKSASGDGFYLVCLNLPTQARSSSNAVRILSLTPPGVNIASVFKRIESDIVKGMTDGFGDFDATGQPCRIFLDLVGFLGDTPALNASLDTLGHTANSCCHLCRYTRQSTGSLGSSYAAGGINGSCSGIGRNFYLHAAVRDCNAQKETCRLLGMKPTDSERELPLHSLRAAMIQARSRIPRTSDGVPLLSGYIDPYLACLVAPDHLLTGHFRDCVNLAFKLLPGTQQRLLAERYMIGYLTDCNLTSQNRLFDIDRKALLSMSMTEIYALSLVAELALTKAVQNPSLSCPISNKCNQAISLVGSASRLISSLWRLPSARRDAPSTIHGFNRYCGMQFVSRLQQRVDSHLSKLRDVCHMSVEDIFSLEEGSTTRHRRAELVKEHSACLLAKRCVDKPNAHRLSELVYTTIPMVGHVSRIGELFFEKAHQSLKRAIRQSNNKDIQLLSMSAVIFNDWEARLNMHVRKVFEGDKMALLACFRLLFGRDAVSALNAHISETIAQNVVNTLGPQSCVPALLGSGGRSVISPRAESDIFLNLSWKLRGNISVLQPPELQSNSLRGDALHHFWKANPFVGTLKAQKFGDALTATARNGTPVLSLCVGQAVEFLCYRPDDINFHTPFVIHSESIGSAQQLGPEGSALWILTAFFCDSKSPPRTNLEFWAALRPIVRVPCAKPIDGFERFNSRYFVRNTLCFARVGVYMRPIALLHDCDPALCSPDHRRALITHNPTFLEQGALFYPRTSVQGYPPRQG